MEWHDQNMINSYFNLAIKKIMWQIVTLMCHANNWLFAYLFIFFDIKRNKKIWYIKKVHKKKEIKINKKQE